MSAANEDSSEPQVTEREVKEVMSTIHISTYLCMALYDEIVCEMLMSWMK